MYDLIIIGGGAAGFAATAYALEQQLDTLLITDSSGKAGMQQHLSGQMKAEQPNGVAIVTALQQHIIAADALCYDRVLAVRKQEDTFLVETQQHGSLGCRAVLIATGATPIPLPVPGAHRFMNQGLGYSAITHAPVCSGKAVAVVGATPRAVRDALALSRVAAQVYLIVPPDATLDLHSTQQLQCVPNVTLLHNYRVTAIEGAASVERITVLDHEGTAAWLRVAAVFVDWGLLPNSAVVRDLVEIDAHGAIYVDARNATNVAGVYAAGDVTTTLCEHSLVAVGAGVRAAMSAYEYLLTTAPNPVVATS